MNAIALSCITFACISGGALLGMFLPGHHLSTDDKDFVRLGTGLIGTIAALVLGLLIATDIAQTRLLLFAQTNNSIPMPFLVVLIFWLTIIFGTFGLFTKPNAIVFSSLFVFALSAAGAIYLVLELGQPFAGLMQISSAPLRNALMPL